MILVKRLDGMILNRRDVALTKRAVAEVKVARKNLETARGVLLAVSGFLHVLIEILIKMFDSFSMKLMLSSSRLECLVLS
jgi:hypothetical protein